MAKIVADQRRRRGLHGGELRFADELREREALREELKDFRRHVTNAGRATYERAPASIDDLVLAVAIALWWCGERRRHRMHHWAVAWALLMISTGQRQSSKKGDGRQGNSPSLNCG